MDRKLTGKVPRECIGLLELPRLPDDVLAGYRALGDLSGLVSDACDELGIACGVPASTLRPMDPKARIAGQALTVLNRRLALPVAEAVAAKVSRLGEIEAHNLARPGDVLVIEGIDGVSNLGGLTASIGKRQGELGAIVDGAVRDVDHQRGIGYPVWARGASPVTGKWRIETVGINLPVGICGIAVHPGDLVVADEVGVCFVPFARAAEVLAIVQKLLRYEDNRLAQIEAGVSVPDLANAKRP